jgi:competence protein ComEC
MEIPWRLYSIIKIVIPFSLGIIFHYFAPNFFYTFVFILSISFILSGKLALSNFDFRKNKFNTIFLILLCGLFFSLGYIRAWLSNPNLNHKYFTHFVDDSNFVYGVIKEVPIFRTSYKTEISVTKICSANKCTKVVGEALIYFSEKIPQAAKLKPGDELVIAADFLEVKNSSNPHCFDFKQYLFNRGITHQAYIWDSVSYKKISEQKLSPLIQYAMNSRGRCLEILKKYTKKEESLGVISALILGYRNNVSQDTYSAFSDTGAIHILAVSGMHLTLLVSALIWVLSFIRIKSSSFKLIILLGSIWFFTLLTGSGSAIIRAAVMLTIILYAKEKGKAFNLYNVLAFVCLAMLLYEPGQIFQAGFQFSVAAILSIIFFQPIVTKLYFSHIPPLQFIWNLIATSIAAQVLVVPLTIFFFHKLPIYFILSGIVPVVISTLAMYLGIIVIIVEMLNLEFLNLIFGPILEALTDIFVMSVEWIRSLPFCSLNDLSFSTLEFFLCYIFIIFLMISLKLKNKITPSLTLLSLTILIYQISSRIYNSKNLNGIIIYDANKADQIDFFEGRNVYSLSNSSFDQSEASFIYQNNRIFHFTKKIIPINTKMDTILSPAFKIKNNFMQFQNKTLLILDKTENVIINDYQTDIVIITNNCTYTKDIVFNKKAQYIIDKNFTASKRQKWILELTNQNVNYIDISKNGAFEIKF